MDEDVPWLYSIALITIILLWVVGAVVFGLAHLNAQVSSHRGNVIAARGGAPSGAFGAAYYGVDEAPMSRMSADLRWGGSSLGIDVPYAALVYGRPMRALGGALSGTEMFFPGPPATFE